MEYGKKCCGERSIWTHLAEEFLNYFHNISQSENFFFNSNLYLTVLSKLYEIFFYAILVQVARKVFASSSRKIGVINRELTYNSLKNLDSVENWNLSCCIRISSSNEFVLKFRSRWWYRHLNHVWYLSVNLSVSWYDNPTEITIPNHLLSSHEMDALNDVRNTFHSLHHKEINVIFGKCCIQSQIMRNDPTRCTISLFLLCHIYL
jgi:hypothetical protein